MKNNLGFTLVEILMILLLVAILSAVAIPQFVDFQTEARNSATQSSLGALRTGIVNQRAQMQLRCNKTNEWPGIANLNNNDITEGDDPCDDTQVPDAANTKFVAAENLPVNPWGSPPSNLATACVGAATGCARGDATGCGGAGFTNGWCYNTATGEIWADSQNNGGGAGATEESY